jgi:hypothetical protein
MKGFITEVQIAGERGKWNRNGQVWPDEVSAACAGADLFGRWMLVEEYRVREVDEEPNCPTWGEYVAKNGLPAKSVSL